MPIHVSHKMHYGACKECLVKMPHACLAAECEGRAMVICVMCNGFRQHININCAGLLEPIHSTHELDDAYDDDSRPYCTECGARLGVELRARCSAKNSDVSITVSPEKVNFQLDQNFVWLVYGYESDAYVANAISIHVTPEEAIDKLSELGGTKRIGKWPFGMELHEAVKAWESRNE